MNFLGISCYYHDAASCIVQDGQVTAAAMEERFTRKKHDIRFPINSIVRCLEKTCLDIDQIDGIVFYEKPYLKLERILLEHLKSFPIGREKFIQTIPLWILRKLPIKKTIINNLRRFKIRCPIYTVRHHLSHAASSFYCSSFEKAAILTIDGVGEYATTVIGIGEGKKIKLLKEIRFPHSIGLLYATGTQYLGFRPNNSEYKVMGLSAYGKDEFSKEFQQLIYLNNDGSFTLDTDYFDFNNDYKMYSDKWVELFGPQRRMGEPITERHKNIAASMQKIVERAILNLAKSSYDLTKLNKLCMAGGVALNCVANTRVLTDTPFDELYIPPGPGDDGGAIGAALYMANQLEDNCPRCKLKVDLGSDFKQDQIDFFLDFNQIKYEKCNDENELVNRVAKLISQGNIIGWFQKGMEWGPRALGYRSILADPRNPQMKDILNIKVKRREEFRPFAPSICIENVPEYFNLPNPLPELCKLMLMVCPVKENMRVKIPAVVHVDGTARLHSVDKNENPLFYELIKSFMQLTGAPVLLNTSFNIRGEPIVCTPNDAFNCFLKTEIDILVMGKNIIFKKDNMQRINILSEKFKDEFFDD